MAEMILPGVYIDVRPEGLIIPGRVGVGNVGIVGTAAKGQVGMAVTLGSYSEARQEFGDYDPWDDGTKGELTLVRALELVFGHGATTAIAVRVSPTGSNAAKAAEVLLKKGNANVVRLMAKTPGTWGNDLQVNVGTAEQSAFVEEEKQTVGAAPIKLKNTPVVKSARNRVLQVVKASGFTRSLAVIYDDVVDPPIPGQVKINLTSGDLTFGAPPATGDEIRVSYAVATGSGVKVTVRQMSGQDVVALETYTVVSAGDLAFDVNNPLSPSALIKAEAIAADQKPDISAPPTAWIPFAGGSNGQSAGVGDYKAGLNKLLDESAHIMVAAGQDAASFGPTLNAHCQNASTDALKRDRIGVTGSGVGTGGTLDAVRSHTLASDRIVFAAPGIRVNDAAAPGQPVVTLPGSYSAAAVAGLLAFHPPHVSLTNKTLSVTDLQTAFTAPQLTELLESRVLALEKRQGFRVVRGITTSTNTAWKQITTRRIVDFAKYGVRSAAEPYIGLLNNSRVRAALRATVNSFLTEMVLDEMLVGYDLDVTATRDDEIKGIANVTMILQPVFSIDFIKVTMFLK